MSDSLQIAGSSSGIPAVEPILESDGYEAELDAWVAAGGQLEGRESCKDALLECLRDRPTFLSLRNLYLTELPPGMEHFSFLEELDLSYNQLKVLPPNISVLSSLTFLDLSQNVLEKLPKEIGALSSLKRLELVANGLRSLPEEIGALSELEYLNLSHNETLLSLSREGMCLLPPPVPFTLPESIGELSFLRFLGLNDINIHALPTSIGRLSSLQVLEIHGNQSFCALPPEISGLSSLEKLNLSYTGLQELPPEIGSLSSLLLLDIGSTPLRDLPNEVLELHPECEVRAHHTGLSANILGRIQAMVNVEGYRGPRFSVSIREVRPAILVEREPSLSEMFPRKFPRLVAQEIDNLLVEVVRRLIPEVDEECVDQVIQELMAKGIDTLIPIAEEGSEEDRIDEIARRVSDGLIDSVLGKVLSEDEERPMPQADDESLAKAMEALFTQVRNVYSLKSWLDRICFIGDFRAGGDRKKRLMDATSIYLKLADEDPDFRETFFNIIYVAGTTCGDRMSLSILHLDIAHTLLTMDSEDLPQVAYFLGRGAWAIELLEGIARKKIPTLAFVDEIEVYLAYPVKLKEALEIPMSLGGMLYFDDYCGVTQKDLILAAKDVFEKLSYEDAYCKFLTEHSTWMEALKQKYPERMAQIADQREDLIDEGKMDEVQQLYIDLTKEALAPSPPWDSEKMKRAYYSFRIDEEINRLVSSQEEFDFIYDRLVQISYVITQLPEFPPQEEAAMKIALSFVDLANQNPQFKEAFLKAMRMHIDEEEALIEELKQAYARYKSI